MKKSFSSLGWRFLIGTLIIYAVQIAVVAVVGQVKPEWLDNTTITLILSVLPLYLIGMPVLNAMVKQMPGEAPVKKSITPGQFVVALIMCYALMYCGNLVGTLITTVVGALKGSEVDNALMAYATESNMIVTFLYMVICAPILEEYIFRKLIVDRTVKYGQGVAIVLSGLMFGLFPGISVCEDRQPEDHHRLTYVYQLYGCSGKCSAVEGHSSGRIPGDRYERWGCAGGHGFHDGVSAGMDRLYGLCIVYSGSCDHRNCIVYCLP